MPSHYGKKIREREHAALLTKRAKHECPKCGKKKVKRVDNALWRCNSCGAEFAGGAYSPQTMVGTSARKAIESLKNATV